MRGAARPPRIETVAVVVPVHDEEELLPACLDALRVSVAAARSRRAVEVLIVVVLDACTDASADSVTPDLLTVEVDAGSVGVARRTGVERALHRVGGVAPERVWIASTDADSQVPESWIERHLDLADDGADVVIGGVRPPLDDLSADRAAAWRSRHRPGVANGHVHGANLGIRASTYLAAGGYAPVEEHEDVHLVAAARGAGARVVATADAWVLTSARLVGRTPGGYARYLREDLGSLLP